MTKTKTSQTTQQSLPELTNNQARIRQLEAEWKQPIYYDVRVDFKGGTTQVISTGEDELAVRKNFEAYLNADWSKGSILPVRIQLMSINPGHGMVLLEEHTWSY